jgi:hypothetical protein
MADSTVIRELVTLLGFDIDDKKLTEFEKRIDRIKKNLKRAAIAFGIVIGALTAMIVKTTRLGDNLVKTSRRLGFSIEQLQAYRFAFDQAGVSAQTFDMAIQRFGRRAAEAAKGQGEAVKALHELGVQLTDNQGNLRSLDDLLMESLDALSRRSDEIDRNRLAMKLFDSEGVRLVQGISEGNKELKENMALFKDLGAVMDKETAEAAEQLTNEWGKLMAAINGVIIVIAQQLMPIVTDIIKVTTEWIKGNKTLAAVLVAITLALIALTGVGFGAIGMISLLNLKLIGLNITVGALLVKILAIPAAIVAIIALIGLIAQDIETFVIGKGDSITGLLWDSLKRLGSSIGSTVWSWLMDAKTWLFSLPGEFVAMLKAELMTFIEQLPDPIRYVLGVEDPADAVRSGAVPLPIPFLPPDFGQGGGTNTTTNDIRIEINAAPGQSETAIANEVSQQLSRNILAGGMIGLGK